MNLTFKRNIPILILTITLLGGLVLSVGNVRVGAYPVSGTAQDSGAYSRHVALFDTTLVHSLQIIMSETDYNKMLAGYQASGEKDYSRADILIDGVRINNVGIRLKGNASLRSALGGMGGGNRPGNGNFQGNGQQPAQQRPGMNAKDGGAQPPAGGRPGQAPGNGAARATPAAGNQLPALQAGDQPTPQANSPVQRNPQGAAPGGFGQNVGGQTQIPFMVKFDEYVEGQNYQGYSEIAIRNYGTSFDAAMLQEPLTNDVARLAGLPATQTAYTGFKINDADEKLYVISEIVNKEYLSRYFDHPNGLLYKAEIGSTLSYRGDEADLYTRSFTQETHAKVIDMEPLIAFMRFLSQSDDASFESDLPKYLDVDALASYLAVNNLMVNTDSLVGMNNNYYLYYDESVERFSLLMWDANESMGKLGGSASYDLYFTNMGGSPGGNRGGGPGGGENVLVKRFMANANFKALYEQKVKKIYKQVLVSGALTDDAKRYSALIHSANATRPLVDINAYDQAVEKIQKFISQRMSYLGSLALLRQ